MRIKTCLTIIALLLFTGALCFGAADEQNKEKKETTKKEISGDVKNAPAVFAPEPVFTFESALDGDQVLHDFVMENKGTAELKIERVKTG